MKILITGSNGLLAQKIIFLALKESVNILATSKGVGFVLDKAEKELNYHPRSFIESLEIIKNQLKNN